jgi:hypothetical protein
MLNSKLPSFRNTRQLNEMWRLHSQSGVVNVVTRRLFFFKAVQ